MDVAGNIAVAGVLAVGAAVVLAATAAADPVVDPLVPDPAIPVDAPPPPPPQGPNVPLMGPLGPEGINLLAQRGQPAVGPLGIPSLGAADQSLPQLLGQNPVPSAPNGAPGEIPNLRAFNNAYLLPQNEVPSAPGTGTEVGVPPGEENTDLGRIAYLRQIHELHQNGNLKGSLLGQVPQQQLGEPLPGTAPPPGTVISPGLVQFLPDPADGPTPPPGLILPPPPAPEG